jgi:hypothetical protein
MSISQSDLEILHARAYEFSRWLTEEVYSFGEKPTHSHYTRSQSKKYGLPYLMWNEIPTVRDGVMQRFHECDRLVVLMRSQTTAMVQLLECSGGLISKSIHDSFSEMVEGILCSIESIILQNKPFVFFADDTLSIQINNFFWELYDAYFLAMCSICAMRIRN